MTRHRVRGLSFESGKRTTGRITPKVRDTLPERFSMFICIPGIWYRPTPESTPQLTLFGSTNLNSRSAHLDTELSFVMLTSAPALSAQLDTEVRHLSKEAHSVGEADWRMRARRVRWGTRALVAAGVEGML